MMRVGGPAQFWIEPAEFSQFAEAVSFCKARGIPVRVVGRGSNLLVRDGGIRGAVFHPAGGSFTEVTAEGDTITAGAGVRFKKVASVARENNIGGFGPNHFLFIEFTTLLELKILDILSFKK